MQVELIRTTAADGLRLDGALHRSSDVTTGGRADVLLCLHGVASNFYGSSLFEKLTPVLLEAGISMLWANTRGHDLVYAARVGGQPQTLGAAFETVDDCRLDLAAWLSWLTEAGFARVGLLGHSLGAIKALYYEAHDPPAGASCVVAMSPPRLSFSAFREGPQSSAFFDSIREAEAAIAEGRGEELMPVRVPFPMFITARTYLDKYGRQERYNILRFVERCQPPLFFTYGSRELATGGVAFAGIPEVLQRHRSQGRPIDVMTVEDADHNYSGCQERAARGVLEWLEA